MNRPHSIYSQFHLDNWTDQDFAKHPAATRKTLAWLLELEKQNKALREYCSQANAVLMQASQQVKEWRDVALYGWD